MQADDWTIHYNKAITQLMKSLSQLCTIPKIEINLNGLLDQLLQEILEPFKNLLCSMVNKALENLQSLISFSSFLMDITPLSKQKHWRQIQMLFQQKCLKQIRLWQYNMMEISARSKTIQKLIQSSRMKKW